MASKILSRPDDGPAKLVNVEDHEGRYGRFMKGLTKRFLPLLAQAGDVLDDGLTGDTPAALADQDRLDLSGLHHGESLGAPDVELLGGLLDGEEERQSCGPSMIQSRDLGLTGPGYGQVSGMTRLHTSSDFHFA